MHSWRPAICDNGCPVVAGPAIRSGPVGLSVSANIVSYGGWSPSGRRRWRGGQIAADRPDCDWPLSCGNGSRRSPAIPCDTPFSCLRIRRCRVRIPPGAPNINFLLRYSPSRLLRGLARRIHELVRTSVMGHRALSADSTAASTMATIMVTNSSGSQSSSICSARNSPSVAIRVS